MWAQVKSALFLPFHAIYKSIFVWDNQKIIFVNLYGLKIDTDLLYYI